MSDHRRHRELPGVDLEPLLEPDSRPGPYAASGLRTITGTRMNPLARKSWYARHADRLSTNDALVVTAAHPELAGWLRLARGLDPEWVAAQPPPEDWPLSRIIPRVVPSGDFPKWDLPVGTYWFDYPEVTRSPHKLPGTPWSTELAARLPQGSFSILGAIGPYMLRNALFRFRSQIWEHPFFTQFDAMVVPDFSSYLNDPRPQALIGERMTQQFVELGCAHGYTMIPILSWQSDEALRRQVDLFGSMYPQVHTVYIELLSKGVPRVPWLYHRFEQIAEQLAHLPLRFLFSGVDHRGMISYLAREVLPDGNFSLVTLWPWMKTGFTPGLRDQKAREFRRRIHALEELHRGDAYVTPPPKPDEAAEWFAAQSDDARDSDDEAQQDGEMEG